MKITHEWLEEKNAFQSDKEWFLSQDKSDAAEVLYALAEHGEPDSAGWLISRLADNKEQRVKIAIFSAELVLHIYEKNAKSDAPRKAIQAAKEYLNNPCEKTRSAAAEAHVAAEAKVAPLAHPADAANWAADAACSVAAAAAHAAAVDDWAITAYSVYIAADAAYAAHAAAVDDVADWAADAKKEIITKIIAYSVELLKL